MTQDPDKYIQQNAIPFVVKQAPDVDSAGDLESRPRPLQVKAADYMAGASRKRGRQAYRWLLKDSFRRKQLGLLCGVPGCGKGILALQMGLSLAAGQPVLGVWQIDEPARTLYASAEDDQAILDNRIYSIYETLPEECWALADNNLAAVPVHGRVALCQADKTSLAETENFQDLKKLVADFKPALLILDTLARFLGVEENDNVAMTAACGLLEEIIAEHDCNILLIHHDNKGAGDLVHKKDQLHIALSQTAIRGASALVGAARWALLMAPLTAELAEQIIGPSAKDKPSGTYVAARVAKKNAGPTEHVLFLERREYGILWPVEPISLADQDSGLSDAELLAREVRQRKEAGQEPLNVSNAGREAFGWGSPRSKKAVTQALTEGLLTVGRRESGRGNILVLPIPDQFPFPQLPGIPDDRELRI